MFAGDFGPEAAVKADLRGVVIDIRLQIADNLVGLVIGNHPTAFLFKDQIDRSRQNDTKISLKQEFKR